MKGCLVLLLAFSARLADAADLRLVQAAQAGDTKTAMRFVRSIDVNARDVRGYSALIWAAAWGDIALTKALIERGAYVNFAAAGGATAWSVAVANGHDAALRMLIQAGSNCLCVPPCEVGPPGSPAVKAIVDRAVRLGDALLDAVRSGDPERVKRALADGAPVGFIREPLGKTALSLAIDNPAIIEALLAAGARVSDDHVSAQSPLDSVARADVAKLLAGAKPPAAAVQHAMRGRDTPLFEKYFPGLYQLNSRLASAAIAGDEPGVRRALAEGADPNMRRSGRPLLLSAIEAGNAPIVALLIQSGAALPWSDVASAVGRSRNPRETNVAVQPLLQTEAGKAPAVRNALSRIQAAARRLPPNHDRDTILEAAQWMLARTGDYDAVSEVYRRELEVSAATLESPDAAAEAARVAEDLGIKLQHCRRLRLGMGGRVRVQVVTRRNRAEVGGWQVFYLPKIFEHAPDAVPGLIPKWSSPAEESLEPGRYIVWARDPVTKQTGERQVVSFAGSTLISLDLSVP